MGDLPHGGIVIFACRAAYFPTGNTIPSHRATSELMNIRFFCASSWLLLQGPGTLLAAPDSAAPDSAEPHGKGVIFFESKVRPILAKHCYKCHSEQAAKLKGGLLLDSKAGWEMGGDSGDAIIPGDVDGSLLIEAVRYEDSDMQMPPKYRLGENEVRILENWIRMGAPDPRSGDEISLPKSSINIEEGRKFWSFQPLATTGAPPTRNQDWAKHDLDRFVLSGLEANGLTLPAPADRATLIRRMTLDLAGLPPTPSEIDAFVNDPAAEDVALAKVVDRLLASPQFGERWGRHWLDIVRYAESVGRTRNYPFPYAWRYRDYVIKSFNEDKPYDRFVTEQLAGDLLPSNSREEKNELHVATGFLALGSQDLNENDRNQYLMDVVDEQIDVTGRALMALTTGCARCHDHKFDPIPTADYYALAGVFRSSDMLNGFTNKRGGNSARSNPELLVKLDTGGAKGEVAKKRNEEAEDAGEQRDRESNLKKRIRLAQKKVEGLVQELKAANEAARSKAKNQAKLKSRASAGRALIARKSGAPDELDPEARREVQREIGATRAQIKELSGQLAKLKQKTKGKGKGAIPNYDGPLAMGVREANQPKNCRINIRGEASNLGSEVPRGFLQVISIDGLEKNIPQNASGRRELAQWITSPKNPLTARVMVNRIWHHLFGRGIVRTVDNFGETGERPTHPALLDHLASRFIENKWSVKKTIREIVLSSTYRMSSAHDEQNYAKDPGNNHYWRMNVRRLEVEAIRDAMLAAGGNLDLEPQNGSEVANMKAGAVIASNNTRGLAGYKSNKRSVYLPVIRNNIPEVMENFDFAEPSSVTGRRDVTTVSTQALFMMNGPFVIQQSRALATLLLEDKGLSSDEDRVAAAYQRTLGREPSGEETKRALAFVHGGAAQDNADAAQKQPAKPSANAEGKTDTSAWALLAQALMAGAEFRYVQ